MIGSSSFLQRFAVLGFVGVIGTGTPTDSTRQIPGYGGVLPVPIATGDEASWPLPDVLGQRRNTVRTEKGRILYANTRVSTESPDATHSSAPPARDKRNCSQVVQTRGSSGLPNS